MIICRKCQRHHPDSATTGTCDCGADLAVDGIALVQTFELLPPAGGLEDLPSLDDEPGPDEGSSAATALKGRNRGRSVTPGRRPQPAPGPPTAWPDPEPGTAAPPPATTPGPPSPARKPGARPGSRPPASVPGPPESGAPGPSGSPPPGRPGGPTPPPPLGPPGGSTSPPPASALGGPPASDPRALGSEAGTAARGLFPPPGSDAAAPGSGPAARGQFPPPEPGAVPIPGPPPGRRARSVNPKDVLAARGKNVPNVGSPPVETPAAETPATAPTVEIEPVPRPPAPGELPCPACGEPNSPTRRFCESCGAKLPTARPQEPAAATKAPTPGRRTWRQRARAASSGPLRYTEGFTGQARMRIFMVVAALVAAVVALAGPGRERVLELVGRGSPDALPATAELVAAGGEATGEVAGFGAANAVDDDRETGVAVVWEPESDTDADTAADPDRVRLTLEEPTEVHRIAIAPGLAGDAPDAPLVLQPSKVRVCADTGACQEVTLKRSTKLRSYKVSLGEGVASVELTVLEVRDTPVVTYPLTVMSEFRVVG